jgi:EAL domain-containing protein (putative c-di-GMP-specific phosphodiesterase class I)/DNA-binding NarL/FixJ family response regulator
VSRPVPVRVLVAEDDAAVRDALAAVVRAEPGLELAAAVADAAQAVEAAARTNPDVALVDVRMPGGGSEAARGIGRRSPRTKVLALSAHEDSSTVLEMLAAGAVGYLVKGTSVEAILESIHQAANGQGSLSVEVTGGVIDELVGELTIRRRADDQREARERRVRRALDEEDAYAMVYQPIYRLDDGEAVGAEALARFRGPPERGPQEWFEEAGEVGLRHQLELACAQAALSGLDQLPDGTFLSVNASPETLTTSSFRSLLAGVDGTRIVVEVTEHAPVEDYDRLDAALERLRANGVRLAVDDAGAGFASLRHILRLRPDFIKLDRTLVAGIQDDRSLQALAAGLVTFAGRLEADVVAEGIERLAEIEALTALGVEYGQGYFLAGPTALPLPAPRRAGTFLQG